MAKIIYALSGEGRGHSSRVIAVSDALRSRGHEVVFCCGGTALEVLESRGESVIAVPALRQVMIGNEVQKWQTIVSNWRCVSDRRRITSELADAFAEQRADLLITDFEAFSPKAALRIGLPVLSFNHQQIVTETRYPLPLRYWPDAMLAGLAIRLIVPPDPEHTLITSFFYPPVRRPDATTLIAPIVRPAVQALEPRSGNHVLVYYNQTEGADYVVEALRQVNAEFVLYNFNQTERYKAYSNLHFKQPSLDGFLEDLAASRAVLCTAGFTLTSESIYLGKPLMVVPNRGIFEQTLNALFLEREGLGRAVIGRRISPSEVRSFLAEVDAFQSHVRGRRVSGNSEALTCIESVLNRLGGRVFVRPADGLPAVPATASIEK